MSIFKRTNLQYEIDYDYERSACTCDAYENGDYCRCTTIENAWIESLNVKRVFNKLYKIHGKEYSEINEYCFDRLCSIFKIYDKYNYEIESCDGYYGEEIDGIYFDNEEKIVEAYNKILELTNDIEKIKYVLELEYGYLIDKVANAVSAVIKEVNTEKIRLPQKEYFVKLSKEVIEDYKNRELPVAVCIKDECEYKLVDGYHRFIANKDRVSNRIIILE